MGGGFLDLGLADTVPRVLILAALLAAGLSLAVAGADPAGFSLAADGASAAGSPPATVAASPEGLVINEVFYDPEGPDDGLEFVELYNPTDETISLNNTFLETGNGAGAGDWRLAVEWTDDVFVEPGRFFVVGEKAVTPPPDWVCDLDLQNGPDACKLQIGETLLDLVGWGAHTYPEYYEGAPCEDVASGSSVGRAPDGADSQNNSADFRAISPPTPGRRNQCQVDVGLVAGSMGVSPALPAVYEQVRVSVEVKNLGLARLSHGECGVQFFEVRDSSRTLLGLPVVDALAPGQSVTVSVSWRPVVEACGRLEAVAVTEGDENPANDTTWAAARAGGGQVVVSEIMYAPAADVSEWVELLNASDSPVDLKGWTIEDSSRKKSVITTLSLPVPAGGYVVLAQDKDQVEPDGACSGLLEPDGGWSSLNNYNQTGEDYADVVCLRDSAGCVSDYVAYSDEWCSRAASSLERVSASAASSQAANWASSAAPQGSTPCGRNSVTEIAEKARGSEITMSSRVISPDGDGADDRVVFSFTLPSPGFRVDFAVFDSEGRLVKKLLDQKKVGTVVQAVWDGTDDEAKRVPPAMYVVHLAMAGPAGERDTSRATVVVAPRPGR